MAIYRIEQSTLVGIADSIRNATGKTGNINVTDISTEITAISESGISLPTLTNEASASDLLLNKELIDSEGNIVTGTMPNNGTVSKTLNTSTTSYTIPQGYHSSSGTVSITTETKSVTPTKSKQTVSPTSGKVLSSVSVEAIPSQYITTTDATAIKTDILSGKTAYVNGSKVTGTMTNNGAISSTMDGIDVKSVTVPAGYTSGGTVSLDNTIDDEVNTQADLLAQAVAALEGKAAGGGTSIDTCTVEIDSSATGLDLSAYAATVFRDGSLTVEYSTNPSTNKVIISDVVCNSSLFFSGGGVYITRTSNNISSISRQCVWIKAANGDVASIELSID